MDRQTPASCQERTNGREPRESDEAIQVVVIDDDPNFVDALSENLIDHGITVTRYTDSVRALDDLIAGAKCDAILLDWRMPRLNGAAFLKLLRESGCTVPVIVLTGNGTDTNEDAALGFGAIDFVDKSRRFSILVKRLQLIVQGTKVGTEAAMPDEFIIGDLSLRMKSGRATWKGNEVELTFTEFRIVEMLATRAGTDLTYREIYDVVHGQGFWAGDGETGFRVNVRSLIKRIRQKFQRIDPDFWAIENYPGYGYRWHSVRARSDGAAESRSGAEDSDEDAAEAEAPPARPSAVPGARRVTA